MSEMALDAIDLLNHLGWNDPVHICGVSMGKINLNISIYFYIHHISL